MFKTLVLPAGVDKHSYVHTAVNLRIFFETLVNAEALLDICTFL